MSKNTPTFAALEQAVVEARASLNAVEDTQSNEFFVKQAAYKRAKDARGAFAYRLKSITPGGKLVRV